VAVDQQESNEAATTEGLLLIGRWYHQMTSSPGLLPSFNFTKVSERRKSP